ncbi:MAG TPA: phage major capsid protein [Desulfosporosinus sp.]|nr:phage major capsid protein [Desulfosporosinus sp.]
MKNLDLQQQKKMEILQRINQAMKDGNEENLAQASAEYFDFLQEAVMAEAKGLVQAADNQVLAGRGARALTSEETKYYQSLIDAMKSRNPKQALTELDVTLPETIIEAVFEDIVEAHPLLDAINFTPIGALTEMIVSTLDGRQLSTWGKLTDEIIKELSAGFMTINVGNKKLSAFLPISKAMLDLGPVWIDRYVRANLSESIFNGLEFGIIDGPGIDSPIGMRRNPGSALDPVTGYAPLDAEVLNEITPKSYGALLAKLAVAPTGLQRTIREIIFVVSPKDYFAKIFPATTFQQPGDGMYVNNIFPFPTRLVQSVYVPENEAIMGLGNRYFMGLGTGKSGKIEYSDEYRFLEDERVYLAKLYGDGKPLDNKSFLRLDITNLKPTPWNVQIANTEADPIPFYQASDARLASLAVGALTLSPAFNKSVFVYTAATTNATNTITAVAKDGEATIEILNGETPVANGAAATWATGENTVTITVTSGTETETYTVIVTKS